MIRKDTHNLFRISHILYCIDSVSASQGLFKICGAGKIDIFG